MTGPSRNATDASEPGEDAQYSETLGESLPWQRELDVAIADIDSRLKHPRRRATDIQQASPSPGQPEISSEIIDEIAWRVAEQLRRDGTGQPTEIAAAISKTVTSTTPPAPRSARPPLPPSAPTELRRLPHGIAISIRIRRPFFRWPFRRSRKQAMITFSDYRIT